MTLLHSLSFFMTSKGNNDKIIVFKKFKTNVCKWLYCGLRVKLPIDDVALLIPDRKRQILAPSNYVFIQCT